MHYLGLKYIEEARRFLQNFDKPFEDGSRMILRKMDKILLDDTAPYSRRQHS
jgi:hypothetical protein